MLFQRTTMFKCIAGIVATVPAEYLKAILFSIMSPLVREIVTTERSNVELHQLAKEVASMIKKSIGNEEYTKLLNRVQQKLDIKRAERKRVRAQQVIFIHSLTPSLILSFPHAHTTYCRTFTKISIYSEILYT